MLTLIVGFLDLLVLIRGYSCGSPAVATLFEPEIRHQM